MKRNLTLLACFSLLASGWAETTINSTYKYAYGANFGWVNAAGDVTNGAVIGEYVCSGYLWAANAGWIYLGDGSPDDGIRYQNTLAADFGVNHDGVGNLSGYAYGANIGWLNFATNGAPRVNLLTGRLGGSVWSANCGWISLSNTFAYVKTDVIQPGADKDGDGITDAWELAYVSDLDAFTGTSDTDGDGVSDLAEYLADTDPLDAKDQLRITFYSLASDGGEETNTLTWTVEPTRLYRAQYRTNLIAGAGWVNGTSIQLSGASNTMTRVVMQKQLLPERFWRVEALRPLSP
jgi:hypothetical protein